MVLADRKSCVAKTLKYLMGHRDIGVLREKSFDDCQHIAVAILAGCDVIISWNFKHSVNVKTAKGVKIITTMEGYKDLLIYPPSALLEGIIADTKKERKESWNCFRRNNVFDITKCG